MKLDLRFSNRPLDEVWCQALAALVFDTPDPDSGWMARLDDKLAGYLKELVAKGIWTGDRGEKLLIASQNALMCDKVLFYGLGNPEDQDPSSFREILRETGLALDRIGIKEFGISIPCIKGLENEYGKLLESSMISLLDIFIGKHMNDHGFLLKIIVSVENELMDRIPQAETGLREYLTPMMEYSLIIDGSYDMDRRENVA